MQYTRTGSCTSDFCNRRRAFEPTFQSARIKSWQLGRLVDLTVKPYQASLIHPHGRTVPHQPSASAKPAAATVRRVSPTFRVQLIQPTDVADADTCDKLLVYLPGTDGTGQAILPQIPTLRKSGYDVWCLYLPPDDRSDWEQLATQVTLLLRQLLGHWRGGHPASTNGHGSAQPRAPAPPPRITVVAESFGCCLALRLAASGAGPELLDRMVLVNPATCFSRSLSGLSSFIAATNLLSLFPRDWYTVAQTTLLPLLVDRNRVDTGTEGLLRSIIAMQSPRASQRFGFGSSAPTTTSSSSSSRTTPVFPTQDQDVTRRDNLTGGNSTNMSSRGPSTMSYLTNAASGGGGGSSGSIPNQFEEEMEEGGRGGSSSREGTLYYAPAAAANFRANLLRAGDPGEEVLARVTCPVLLITSARDRLLPSIAEGARLQRALPNARRILLPDSGHAAMLERGFDLVEVMRSAGFAEYPYVNSSTRSGTSNSGSSSSGGPMPLQGRSPGATGPAGARVGAGTGVAARLGVATRGTGNGAAAAATPGDGSGGPTPPHQVEGVAGPRSEPSVSAVQAAVRARGAAAAATVGVGMGVGFPGVERMSPSASFGQQTGAGGAPGGGPASHGGGGGSGSVGVARRVESDGSAGGKASGGGGSGGNKRSRSSTGGGGGGEAWKVEDPQDIDSAFDEWCQNLAPWRAVVSPVVRGFDLLPNPGSPAFNRPMLFVGNHQKMGFYDTPLLVYELYVRGYRVRGLAHPGHWAGPLGRWFESFGSVKASPLAAYRLLRRGEKVLLFPGGAKEVVKKRGQEYTLLWKDSPDFVRLAARCNALVVPFAAVGADDAYEVIMDTDEIISHPLLGPLTKGLLRRISPELDPQESIFPVTRLPGVGLPTPIPIPNLQRLYFQFAAPVDPCALGTDINDPQQVQQLYDRIKTTVTHAMTELLAVRAADRDSQLGPRLARSLQQVVPGLGLMGGVGVDGEEVE